MTSYLMVFVFSLIALLSLYILHCCCPSHNYHCDKVHVWELFVGVKHHVCRTPQKPLARSLPRARQRKVNGCSCLGTLCRCETSCLQNATKTVGTQLAKGEATESKWMQVGDEAQCPTNNGGMPGMNGDDELRMGKGDCGWRWTEDR
ncbi:uncharacterized protein LOC110437028 isoform X2 [Sorghum bicolor]|uniref:uncharacterized protein LOC110437028 isoform X2 n=1 Tax=Sorghum bicolor TaxID=4558 RepID=UPI000B425E26|nr:uncharacterized protein LOC110437028 isoform X2 [Sorghum bicolor]|eukprot:XP_021320731.1 uncharacterized protein LOC110437028 isoform X2 [Sorghum bicolor]